MNTKDAIYSAKELGKGKVIMLGLQHMFAMFGATVLVPLLTGLDVSTTLLFAGLGTLLFHFITKGKVPAFLGSSFAFLGGYGAIAPLLADGSSNIEMIPYSVLVNSSELSCICCILCTDQSIFCREGNGLLPADRNWSDHHFHRSDTFSDSHRQLFCKLADCPCSNRSGNSLQHLW